MAATRTLGISLLILALTSLRGNSQDQDQCSGQPSCSNCIGTAGCSWCSTLNFVGPRCSSNLNPMSCNGIESATGNVTQEPSGPENPLNVTNVNLRLSVGVPQTFTITVTPLRNLPLDLYVLIDLSSSMREELDSLKTVAGEIANNIRGVTNNVRIGFGSFIDKVTRPYAYTPVVPPGVTCTACATEPIYAFRHQITLTSNITFYNRTLQGVDTTINADLPENGLEGLAQVVACENIIGWRNRSATGLERGRTRVVLFMTDDAFHYAGEGQFAGILKPYKGECLLDPAPSDAGPAGATEFTRWREVDYPSVGQIVEMLQQREVAVIFAVQENRLRTYQNLSRLINLRSRSSVAQLVSNGQGILDLINTEYERILQEVALVPDDSTELDISIRPMCPAGTTELTGESGCDGVQLNEPVMFEVNVTLNSCENVPRVGSTPRTHRIVSPTFGDFTITYTGDCVCSCARNQTRQDRSPMCNFNGDFVCGVCECYPGWCGTECSLKIGDVCDCDRLTNTCPTGGANNLLCSGQGVCCEGTCICREDDNGYLFRHSNPANPDNVDCACPPEEVACRANPTDPANACVNGTCGCQGCECQDKFFGRFCDARDIGTCNDNMDLMCLDRCVSSNFNNEMCQSCERTRPILATEIPEGVNLIEFLEREANNRLEDPAVNSTFVYTLVDCTADAGGCTYRYYLLRRAGDMYALILNQEPEVCVTASGIVLPFPAWVFAIIVIGALLILGIIVFVLIRIIISILDYLEVKRWERETKDADFSKNQNPLYQSPEMKYENVAYGRE